MTKKLLNDDLEVQAYEEFMQQLAAEDWTKSKKREKPDLEDFTHDVNDKEIAFMGDARIKPAKTELPLMKTGKYEEYAKEIYHCYTNPLYTIKNYFKIIHQQKGQIDLVLYDFQVQFIKSCLENTRLIAKWPRQVGKCVVGSTKINIRRESKNYFKKNILKLIRKIDSTF